MKATIKEVTIKICSNCGAELVLDGNPKIYNPRNNLNGKKWSGTDIIDLKNMVNQGYSIIQIAKHFGRTVSSVKTRMYRLGMSTRGLTKRGRRMAV